MNKDKINAFIQTAKDQTGWAFNDIPWFSGDEIFSAEKVRQDLLAKFSGDLAFSANGTKPHLGPLSPGCRHCGTPNAIFHFINRQCTRTCSFCPEDRSKNPDLQPWTDDLWFEEDDLFIHFLKTFSIQSIGFTGGEPLMALDKLVTRVEEIRRQMGREIHLRLYSNGDLLDDRTLQQLHKAGLDEIRINISARDYNLFPVRLARLSGIPVVTVEIPAIPEHEETIKEAMLEMEDLGVDYLNLIQLEVTRNNYMNLNLGNYHVLPRSTLLPVFESELCSLTLMLYRQEKQLRLPVSYCGFPYRFEVTNAMRSGRYNRFDLQKWEEVTEAGIIRTLAVEVSNDSLQMVLNHLNQADGGKKYWAHGPGRKEILFHPELLPVVFRSVSEIKIKYHEKFLSSFSLEKQEWGSNILAEVALSPPALDCWHQIYIKNRDSGEAIKEFIGAYPVKEKSDLTQMSMEKQLLGRLSNWERINDKFPPPIF